LEGKKCLFATFTTFLGGELTMDTSISNLHVILANLSSSPHPEDHEVAGKCGQIVVATVEMIKPILRYICSPRWFQAYYKDKGTKLITSVSWRCVLVMKSAKDSSMFLFLNENGNFFEATSYDGHVQCGNQRPDYFIQQWNASWTNVFFDELLQNIRAFLTDAEEKRRKHLENVVLRRETLDKILAVINKPASAEDSTHSRMVVQYIGNGESLSVTFDHAMCARVLLCRPDETEKVAFCGGEFSDKEFEAQPHVCQTVR
jgi:hypothetical protein